MLKNQNNVDQSAIDLSTEDELEIAYTEEVYLIEAFNSVSETIISDDFFERNRYLIKGITNSLHDRNTRHGDMCPRLAGRVLESVFASISKFGIR